jgi:hypothetical protein
LLVFNLKALRKEFEDEEEQHEIIQSGKELEEGWGWGRGRGAAAAEGGMEERKNERHREGAENGETITCLQ